MRDDRLLRNGIYIMGITAIPSLLGFGFWVLASRGLSAADVGRAAALISAMLFVSVLANLGMGQTFISRLPARADAKGWSQTVTVGLSTVAVVSLLSGGVAAFVVPTVVGDLRHGTDLLAWLLLPVGIMATACSVAIDHACIADRDARPAFVRNAVAAAMRLCLIPCARIVGVNGVDWIMCIWVGSIVIIDIVGITRVLPRLHPGFRLHFQDWRAELRALRGLSAGHQSINIGAQVGAYLLPILVASRLGPAQNAYFYTTFLLAGALFFVAPAISDSLFAEGAHRPEDMWRCLRRAVRYIACLAGVPGLVLFLVGGDILRAFGPAYAHAGTGLLRILVAMGVFAAAFSLVVTVLRVQRRLREGALLTILALVVGVAAAWLLLPSMGVDGAGIGWGVGQLVGLVAGAAVLLPRPALRPGRLTAELGAASEDHSAR